MEDWLEGYLKQFGSEIQRKNLGRIKVEQMTGLSPSKARRLVRAAKDLKHKYTNRAYTIVSLWDVHAPDHFSAGWDTAMLWCQDNQPDEFILGGDFLELESASSYTTIDKPSIDSDIENGRELLNDLRSVMPDAKGYYLQGNHETRLERYMASKAPHLFKALKTIPELLGLEELNIEWVPRLSDGKSTVLKRGDFHFVHGYWTSKHHAAKHLDVYGMNVAYGHKHNPQMYCQSSIEGVRYAYAFPCMRTRSPDWMEGKPSNWVNGFGVTYFNSDWKASNYMVIMQDDGSFVWNGLEYDAL